MPKQNSRLEELEQRFINLESQLKESPEKQALSVLHAIIHESRRAQSSKSNGNSDALRTMDEVANLYKSAPAMEGAAENKVLAVGTRAPDFTLPDANNNPISLADFRGKNVVLVFYPLDWSPACSDQLSLYQNELQEFEKYNAQVLGISVDSIYSHGAWAAVRRITFPLLADFYPKGAIAQRYNIYRNSTGFSERALYVVDSSGVIRYAHVSPQLNRVPDIYELLDHLKSIEPRYEPTMAE